MQGSALLTLSFVYPHEQRFAYPGPRLIYQEIFYLPTRVIEK